MESNSTTRSRTPTRPIDLVALVPEEKVWLASLKSRRTRRAYENDVRQFIAAVGIESADELYRADHKAVTLWERHMREEEGLEATTVRRRLSALSSLFTHLVNHGVAGENPVREIKRPRIERRQGKTLAFSKKQARAILDSPATESVQGLRDRAILAVGLQVGFRRAEVASLQVKSLHQNRGYDSLWVKRKGGKRHSVAIHPQVAQRIRDYLAAGGHADDLEGRCSGRCGATGRRRHAMGSTPSINRTIAEHPPKKSASIFANH